MMALEYYDAFWRQYPAQFAEQAAQTIEHARAAMAVAAQNEAARVQRVLSAQVAETRVAVAHRLADRSVPVHLAVSFWRPRSDSERCAFTPDITSRRPRGRSRRRMGRVFVARPP
ncbi:MAG: hypothetical protein ABSF69_11655 [Polyangiaceae bacterium]